MGQIRQKRKNRSSLPKARPKSNRLKNGRKKINVLGNAIIAQNWDRNATLNQNYRRLGLLHSMNAPTGGIEKRSADDEPVDSLYIKSSAKAATKKGLGETKVERDPETGKILRVVHDNEDDEVEVAGRRVRRSNPLNDPLDDLSDREGGPAQTDQHGKPHPEIVRELELQAAKEDELVKKRKPRQQSQREGEWVERLLERHGEDYAAMVRDRKLNPMQQSEGDLRRRIRKWKQSRS